MLKTITQTLVCITLFSLFITTCTPKTQIHWETELSGKKETFNKFNTSFSSQNILYLRTTSSIIAIHQTTGKKLWQYKIKSQNKNKFKTQIDQVETNQNYLYFTEDYLSNAPNQLVKVNAHNGKVVWKKNLAKKTQTHIDQRCILFLSQDKVLGISLENGEKQWELDRQEKRFIGAKSFKNIIYTVWEKDGQYFLAALDFRQGKYLWQQTLKTSINGIVGIFCQQIVLNDTKGLYAFDLSGKKNWQSSYPITRPFRWNQAQKDDVLYFTSKHNGKVRAMDLKTGKLIWTALVNKGRFDKHIIYKKYVVIKTAFDKVTLLNKKNGQSIKEVILPGNGIATTLINAGNHLFYGDNDNKIYSINIR